VMWPKHVPLLKQPVNPAELVFTDRGVQADHNQARAVADVLNLLYCDSPVPFMLRGAFGTGKTRTLAEIAWQATLDDEGPVLICTESNGAADGIAGLLGDKDHFSGPSRDRSRLFRFNAMHRSPWTVDSEAVPYCRFDDVAGVYKIPIKQEFLTGVDVVVTTFDNASVLFGIGLKGVFRMILCDESSQAIEPRE
jgi:hypothetical protein